MDNIVFADIEASSLINGYPIEIGWAWRNSGRVECASILIAPPERWRRDLVWDPGAETVHGLSRKDICKLGDAPRHACGTLNMALDGRDLVFDTGRTGVDATWLKMLYAEAAMDPSFGILSVSSEELVRNRAALIGIPDSVYAAIQALAPQIPHRAAADAAHWAWWMIAIEKVAELDLSGVALAPVFVDQLTKCCADIQLPPVARER